MRKNTVIILANFFLVIALLFLSFSPVQAQTEVLEESTAVTAVVIDRIAPSTPILISPADESKLRSGYIEFVWQESTDNWLMDHYILVVNGSTKFDNIPLTASEITDYKLTYDSSTGYYRLTMKTNRLDDGSYTWKIIAQDYHANQASSVTWDFTVDTKAPSFIITKIEEQTVEIVAGTIETLPTEAIVLEANEPLLSGTGEANSSVELTVSHQGEILEKQTFTIGSNGTWSVTLGTLPRDQVITLDFLIIDPIGNINLLNDLPLILYTPIIVISLPSGFPLPTAAPAGPPIIQIPILPPLEYLPPTIRQVPKQIVYYVRNYSSTVSTQVVSLIEKLWMISVLLALLTLPITKLLTLMATYRPHLSADLMKQLLWFIGWWQEQPPAGIVLDKKSQTPVSQSLVIISGQTCQQQSKRWVLLTNQAGIFAQIQLPDGQYRISVQHPKFFFPTLTQRPAHLDQNRFYTGAMIEVKNGLLLPLLVIPVEQLEKQRFQRFYALKRQYLELPSLSMPMAVMALVITVTFPTSINVLSALTYLALLGRKYYLVRRKNCQFLTVLFDKTPLSGVVVAAQPAASQQTEMLKQTSLNGSLDCYLKPGEYGLQVIDFKHQLTEGDRKTQTEFKADTLSNYVPLVLG